MSASIADIRSAYASGAMSPVELTRAVLDRAGAADRTFNAFVLIDQDSALDAARASERRWRRGSPLGLLDGIPATVKDLMTVKGWPTRRGSVTSPATPSPADAPPVARLREAGCVFIGKTTTSEFGWKGVTDSPLTGVTRHPYLPGLTPGGSSGGAAVAAALDLGKIHLATDGGGSIRIPAAFCGLFGFKPTFGTVPVFPRPPAGTLWHQGPISRSVADAIEVMRVIARPDQRDPLAVPAPDVAPPDDIVPDLNGLVIGYSETLGYARPDSGMVAVLPEMLSRLEAMGARVEPVEIAMSDPIEVMRPLWSIAIAVALAGLSDAQLGRVDPPLRMLAAEGARLDAIAVRQLEAAREDIARTLIALHTEYDLIVTPQVAVPPFEAGRENPGEASYQRWWQWSPYTYPYNLSGQPCATVPCGFTPDGRPVAMQLVGRRFDDAGLLRAALAIERNSGNDIIALDFPARSRVARH